jgi:hypothetical protein
MNTNNLIIRRIIDEQEMVCVAPWYWEQINECLEKPQPTINEKRLDEIEFNAKDHGAIIYEDAMELIFEIRRLRG